MRGVLGILWAPTLLPSHFQCAVIFKDGLSSALSRVLEARMFNGLKGATCYEAPGYPSVLFIGEPVIELLDAMYPGRPKEAAGIDPFGRVCIEAKATNMLAVDGIQAVEFVTPVFSNPLITEDPREVLSKRRTA